MNTKSKKSIDKLIADLNDSSSDIIFGQNDWIVHTLSSMLKFDAEIVCFKETENLKNNGVVAAQMLAAKIQKNERGFRTNLLL